MSSTLLEKLLGPEDDVRQPAISDRALGLFMAATFFLCIAVVSLVGYSDIIAATHAVHQFISNDAPPSSFWDQRIR